MATTVVAFPIPAPNPTGPFKQRPGQYIRREFLDWVRDTGQPDTWRYHTATKPSADDDFEELDRFAIPEALRRTVGRATCPICSALSPKYFEGALAWFPAEGVLRAIGHECAKSHFGTERANAAIAARKHHAAVEGAQNFLLDTLPVVSQLRDEVRSLSSLAMYVDAVRRHIWAASSKTACSKLAKMGEAGVLTVEVTRAVDGVDAFGKSTIRYESEIVGRFPVAGLNFLSRRFLASALALQTSDALALVRAADANEALDFICNELKVTDYLFQAERLARAAVEQVERLREAVDDARQFLAEGNLASLSSYTRTNHWAAPVHFDFDPTYPARFRAKAPTKKWKEISIPAGLRQRDR